MVEELWKELASIENIEAIALGGSRAGSNYDEKSDYDVYVYCINEVTEGIRKEILQKYCSHIEIGNHFWEYEDNCTLKNGVDIDILYRNLDEFADGISSVVEKHQAQNGYTTCMWHNLCTCKIMYDKNGRLANLQKKYDIKYPKQLKENIIERNMKLLRHAMPAYEIQIAKAAKRKDIVSINHRVTEFMASYFDVIFAINELTHPGEKRLIELCEKRCRILPENFRNNIEVMFRDMFVNTDCLKEDVNQVISALEKIIISERGKV